MKNILSLFAALACVISSALALNPSRDYEMTPKDVDLAFEEVTIPTEDGANLHGWYFPAVSKKASYNIVIISDDGDGNMADQIEMASKFLTLGFHVLCYDYRGYGKSSDFDVKKKFFIHTQFEKDLQGALKFVRTAYSKIAKISFYGQGIGAGLSICVGANDLKIRYIIADSPYTYFDDMSKSLSAAGEDIMFPMAYDKIKMEPKYNLESETDLDKLNAKLLYIVGGKDPVYNTKMIKAMHKLRPARSTVYVVKNATKSNTFSSDKEAYYNQIKTFLE
ncbi:MAG TPA: hypothetical protein EYN38_05355 [Flavobacteriales bacterium]|nr:hypothetical protein [Flavobacteriales bacterium]HIO72516.1 hypothetical protein [Flavobacteriales bacterium]